MHKYVHFKILKLNYSCNKLKSMYNISYIFTQANGVF